MFPEISKSIAATRFPIIIGPIMIHCQSMFQDTVYKLFWGEMVGQVTVPLFFIISGYLFFQNLDGTYNAYLKKIKKRVFSLIIPYILWNFIAFLFYWSIGIANADSFLSSFWVVDYHDGHSPADGPLWFVRTLIILLPLTPLMFWINTRKKICLISILLYVLVFTNYGIFSRGFCIGFACFNFGSFLALGNFERKLCNISLNYQKIITLLFLFVIFCVFDYIFRFHTNKKIIGSIIHYAMINVGSILILSTPFYLDDKLLNILNKLGKASFFVYAMHEPIVPYMSKFIMHYCGNSNLGYSITVILVTTICLGVYKILSWLPLHRLSALLNGNR